MIAKVLRTLFGPSKEEQDLRLAFDKSRVIITAQEQVIIKLTALVYKPNEKVELIREPILDCITACQGDPVIVNSVEDGEPVFSHFDPPNIQKILKKLEIAMEACQKAIAEQTKGIDGP